MLLEAVQRGATAAAGGSGWIYITDVTPTGAGVVTGKIYQDAGDTVLQWAVSSTLNVRVHVLASYPLVVVHGEAGVLSRDGDSGHFSGYVDVTVAGSSSIVAQVTTPDDTAGPTDTMTLEVDAPPEVVSVVFTGGYPGSQWELKEGDSFTLTGTTSKTADAIEIDDWGACAGSVEVIVAGTSFTVTGTIADRGDVTVLRPARVRARSVTTGDYGGWRATNVGGSVNGVNVVACNNLHPTVVWGSKSYPPGQSALKGSETALVGVTLANLNSVLFSSPTGELSVDDPLVIEASKLVRRIGGTYNDAVPNLRGEAVRTANDAHTVASTVVVIAAVPAQMTVSEPQARLRTGPAPGAEYVITIGLNQTVTAAPSVDADVDGGVFTGAWGGAGAVWTRTLRVEDATHAVGTYTWQNPYAVNRAGLVTTAITGDDGYVIGGFVARAVTFDAWSQTAELDVEVTSYAKLQAGIFTSTNQQSILNPVQGNQDDLDNTWTVLAVGVTPTVVFWNDLEQANANSSGTAQLLNVEETV